MMGRTRERVGEQASETPRPESGPERPGDLQSLYGNQAVADRISEGQAPDSLLGAPRAGAPGSKRQALARHKRNRSKIDRLMRSALAQDADPSGGSDRMTLLRNTAQWIDEGQATLHVLTPTHDAQARPACPADNKAYFDTRTTYDQAGADYDGSVDAAGQATNDAGLLFQFSNVAGSMDNDGVTMTLVDPVSFSEGDIVRFFTHEVQHDADQHRGGESWELSQPAADPAALLRAPQWAYNNHASELRAYWMMAEEGTSTDDFGSSTDLAVNNFNITAVSGGVDVQTGTADDVSTTVSTAFANVRQQDIFNHMYQVRADNTYLSVQAGGANSWTQAYGYLPHYYAVDPAFKSFVDGYSRPASGNLVNSVRIQDLSDAVEAGRIYPEASDLEPTDLVFLRDAVLSKPFWDRAAAQLDATMLALLRLSVVLAPVQAGAGTQSVQVVGGDSLSAIADRYLGDPLRWPEIYALNRGTIGADPGQIVPAQSLIMPAI